MKILLKCHCANEYNDEAPPFAIVEVDRGMAATWLGMHDALQAFISLTDNFGSATVYVSNLTPVLHTQLPEEYEDAADRLEVDDYIILPDDFELLSDPDAQRADGTWIRLDNYSVDWQFMSDRAGDDLHTTNNIPWNAIKLIASGAAAQDIRLALGLSDTGGQNPT